MRTAAETETLNAAFELLEGPTTKIGQALQIIEVTRDRVLDGPDYALKYDRATINTFHEGIEAILAGAAALLREAHKTLSDAQG